MINKPLLQRMGLNSFQIAAVFANPITVTFSSHGNATRMSIGGYMYGIRLYGD
jgi:hypothetical protein